MSIRTFTTPKIGLEQAEGNKYLIVIERVDVRFERFWSLHAYGAKVIEKLKTASTQVVFEEKKPLKLLRNGRLWTARKLRQKKN